VISGTVKHPQGVISAGSSILHPDWNVTDTVTGWCNTFPPSTPKKPTPAPNATARFRPEQRTWWRGKKAKTG